MARRSKETIEQDQGDILEQVYKAHTVGLSPVYPNSQQTEVREQELRPQRAPAPSPIPPGWGEAHPRRSDLQALVKQGKLETRVKEEMDTAHHASGRRFLSMKRHRSYYKLSQAQFASMQTQDLIVGLMNTIPAALGEAGPARVPQGVHKPVRDEYDAGTTDEEMIEDRQQRAEGTSTAWARTKKRFQEYRETGHRYHYPAL